MQCTDLLSGGDTSRIASSSPAAPTRRQMILKKPRESSRSVLAPEAARAAMPPGAEGRCPREIHDRRGREPVDRPPPAPPSRPRRGRRLENGGATRRPVGLREGSPTRRHERSRLAVACFTTTISASP